MRARARIDQYGYWASTVGSVTAVLLAKWHRLAKESPADLRWRILVRINRNGFEML